MSETGKWIMTGDIEEWYGEEAICPVCGMRTIDWGNFCPDCGADMREEGEQE